MLLNRLVPQVLDAVPVAASFLKSNDFELQDQVSIGTDDGPSRRNSLQKVDDGLKSRFFLQRKSGNLEYCLNLFALMCYNYILYI